jgi:hypothetical protein
MSIGKTTCITQGFFLVVILSEKRRICIYFMRRRIFTFAAMRAKADSSSLRSSE